MSYDKPDLLVWIGNHTSVLDCALNDIYGETRGWHIGDARWMVAINCQRWRAFTEESVQLLSRNMHVLTRDNFGDMLDAYMALTVDPHSESRALEREDAMWRFVQPLVGG